MGDQIVPVREWSADIRTTIDTRSRDEDGRLVGEDKCAKQADVAAVEDVVGMGAGAWDCVDPREIIDAARSELAAQLAAVTAERDAAREAARWLLYAPADEEAPIWVQDAIDSKPHSCSIYCKRPPCVLRMDRDSLAARVKELEQAVEWYGEQARLCRLIHSGGDPGRHALQDDGGKRALAALAAREGKGGWE
jgi:hypothetical protein